MHIPHEWTIAMCKGFWYVTYATLAVSYQPDHKVVIPELDWRGSMYVCHRVSDFTSRWTSNGMLLFFLFRFNFLPIIATCYEYFIVWELRHDVCNAMLFRVCSEPYEDGGHLGVGIICKRNPLKYLGVKMRNPKKYFWTPKNQKSNKPKWIECFKPLISNGNTACWCRPI